MNLKPNPDNSIILKSAHEIGIMRESGQVVASVVKALREQTVEGMTTKDLDEIAARMFKQVGAESTALGYFGYPGHICVSVNDEVVHGIPGQRKLRNGDLVKCDVAARYRGYCGDTTGAFIVGGNEEGSEKAIRLMDVTREAMMKGIAAAQPGAKLTDVGAAIEAHVKANGLHVVRDFVGHGIGRSMHEAPQVVHYGPGGRGPVLRSGMVIAIEPQVNLGSPQIRMLEDRWTAVTVDNSLSCHWEHTVAITADGPEILTLPPENGHMGAD